MKVLLTGAAGFIGSHLAERLCARGDRVVGLDNFDPFYDRAIKAQNLGGLLTRADFSLVEGDLLAPSDLAGALAGGDIDVVVHLAALAGIGASLKNPQRYFGVNVMGTLQLFEAAVSAGIRRFVFASSSSVYGADSALPFREDAPCGRPLSPYAASKRAAELYLRSAQHLNQSAVTSLRFFTVYGPRQRPDLAIAKFAGLIRADQPIEVMGDGSSERDYTYVDDIIDGVVAAIDQQSSDPTPRHRLYNLGGQRAISLTHVVQTLSATLGRVPQIIHRPDRPEDLRRTLADVTRAETELGFRSKVDFETGIERYVAWLTAQSKA
jgi:UDP-glucuronate 4-epimerase